jgi:hypothetical protein
LPIAEETSHGVLWGSETQISFFKPPVEYLVLFIEIYIHLMINIARFGIVTHRFTRERAA